MRITILTEAGSSIGLGHLSRCLSLAEGFRKRNIDVSFFLKSDCIIEFLNDFNVEYVNWLEPGFFDKYAGSRDFAIVDSYNYEINIANIIFSKFDRVLFFDDTKRLTYPGGYVLNGALNAQNIEYPNDKITYLLGSSYQVLRKEFWSSKKKEIKPEVQSILLTFGGSDPFDLTTVYLQKIVRYHSECKKHVIIGSGFKNIDRIKKVCDHRTIFHSSLDGEKMKQVMLQSDLAISATGQTINELAVLGVPTIGILAADNQSVMYQNWQKCGFLISEEYIIKKVPLKIRLESHYSGIRSIDGKGVSRILEIIC